jgi:hypothetical protein
MKSAILALVSVLAGCAASQTATTTITAADLPLPAAREVAPSTTEQGADERPAAEIPKGELVCRAKSPLVGTIELYVDGAGEEASASLRTIAPSGVITLERLRAHRHKGLVFADDPAQTDLVVHAATVAPHDGKKMIRLGEPGQTWASCE